MRKEADFDQGTGRDAGKKYKITEMPAEQAFDWGCKALLAMAKSGVNIPDDIVEQGMAGVALVVVRAVGGLEFMSINSLKKELLGCVSIYVDPKANSLHVRPITGQGDIEEARTIYDLCVAVIELHLGFSIAEGLSKLVNKSTTPSAAA